MPELTATGTDADPIVREIHVQARPETVFEFFVDPDRLVRWMGDSATLEPRPGGLFRVVYGKEGENGTVRGEYLTVEKPGRVVFTWGWEDPADPIPPGGSTVEVTLREESGGTLVRLEHSGLRGDSRRSHDEGWIHFMGRLAGAVDRPNER
jgi:uncharacterized protein YndB with AHSA1/START domain